MKTLSVLATCAALGAGAAVGVTACGEDRGSLRIEGGTTDGTAITTTGGTDTAPTAPPPPTATIATETTGY